MVLLDLREEILTLPTLEKKRDSIREQKRVANDELTDLLEKYKKESRDIEKLEQSSFTTFLLKLSGRHADKVYKKEKEELEAKLAYDRAYTHHVHLAWEEEELDNKIEILRDKKEEYEKKIDENREALKENPDFIKLEEEKQMLLTEITIIESLLRTTLQAIQIAESATASLRKASNWATLDLVSGRSFFKDMAKYSHIDDAEQDVNLLASYLQELEEALRESGINMSFSLTGFKNSTDGQRFVDMFFDNVFTDFAVKGKINDNYDLMKDKISRLYSLERELKLKDSQVEEALEKNREKEEKLILENA